MHAIAALCALVILLPHCHTQETVNTTTEATTIDNSATSSISTANITNSDVKNDTDSLDKNDVTIVDNNLNNSPTNNNSDSDVTIATTTVDPNAPKNCTTPRDIKGVCVHRRKCDYSTPSIDLTLYAPKWYIKVCEPAEVCCPFDSLVEIETANVDENFDFNEDD